MEFLDPKAERRHHILLFIGYGLIAIAIAIASLILLYWSYGYSLNSDGKVEQSGLVFVGTRPEGATIYLDDKPQASKSNAKLNLKSADYSLKVTLEGYRDWQHHISVQGSDVQRFDYINLIPTKLEQTVFSTFVGKPHFASQSPDRRWLAVKDATLSNRLMIYDLKTDKTPSMTDLLLPETIFTVGDGEQTWTAEEWSNNNRHILVSHSFTIAGEPHKEYLLIDRTDAAKSQNLTTLLALSPTDTLELFDKKPDRYYILNSDTRQLRAITQSGEQIINPIPNVLQYKSHSDDILLYVSAGAVGTLTDDNNLEVVLRSGGSSAILKKFPVGEPRNFLLDVARYDNVWFVAVGDSAGQGVNIFRNPLDQTTDTKTTPKPWRFLRTENPQSVSFSSNARFIKAQNGNNIAIYDAEYATLKRFQLIHPLEQPQIDAKWVDAYHLAYISGTTINLVDYDNSNHQSLVQADSSMPYFYSPNGQILYTFIDRDGTLSLSSTSMRVKK